MSQGQTAVPAGHAPAAHPGLVSRAFRLLGRLTVYTGELGPLRGFYWYCAKLLARLRVPGTGQLSVKPPDLKHAVRVRMFPSSDDFVFDQIYVRHEYSPFCEGVRDARFILDLGANVGYASALFASKYPSAKVIAVEPDPGNGRMCEQNLRPYGDRVTVMKGAVWSRSTRLALRQGHHCDGGEWDIEAVEAGPGMEATVDAWDVPTLMAKAQQETIDLLKIDIEGGETNLFASNTEAWLPRVRNLCVELHGDDCREIFFNALRGYDFDLVEQGEATMCFNLRKTESNSLRASGG